MPMGINRFFRGVADSRVGRAATRAIGGPEPYVGRPLADTRVGRVGSGEILTGRQATKARRNAAVDASIAGRSSRGSRAAYQRGMRMGEANKWRRANIENPNSGWGKAAQRGKSVSKYMRNHKTMTATGAGATLLGINAFGSNRSGSRRPTSQYGYRRGQPKGMYRY